MRPRSLSDGDNGKFPPLIRRDIIWEAPAIEQRSRKTLPTPRRFTFSQNDRQRSASKRTDRSKAYCAQLEVHADVDPCNSNVSGELNAIVVSRRVSQCRDD